MLAPLLALTLAAAPWNARPEASVTVTRLDGSAARLGDLGANVTVISYWGTFCGPCLDELPLLEKAFEQRGADVAFVAVSIDPGQTAEDRAKVAALAKKLGLRMPVVIDHGPLMTALTGAGGNVAIPSLWVIDPDFQRWHVSGFDPSEKATFVADLSQRIAQARARQLPASPVETASTGPEPDATQRVMFAKPISEAEWRNQEPRYRQQIDHGFPSATPAQKSELLAQVHAAAVSGHEVRLAPFSPAQQKAIALGHQADALANNDPAGALERYQKVYAAGIRSSGFDYNAACLAARAGKKDLAFTWLSRAVYDGFDDAGWAAKDEDLTSLRSDRRFARVTAQMRAKHDQKLADEGAKAPELQREILAMVQVDQDARAALIHAGPGKHPELAAKLTEVDRKDTARMKEIIAQHGWPGRSLVGESAAHAAWLLVQHADLDRPFQEQCLPLLEAAVKAGEASAIDLAYFTDRVLVAEGKPQRYGTQFRNQNGKLEADPMEDSAHVDDRRRAIGLDSLADYEKQMERVYRP
jgi:thiol-disulfide isomerase/thioredoxin